jgi:hypothetical protein
MKIHIDFSVLTPHSAVGNVHGEMEFQVVPRQGELVSFISPKNKATLHAICGVTYQLKVEHVIHSRLESAPHSQLSLEDLTLPTTQDAEKAMAYLEQGFGLYADFYESRA